MALCSVIELGNVISPWNYGPTKDGQRERGRMVYGRQRCRRLIAWVFFFYEVSDENGDAIVNAERDVYWRYVEQQARVLCHYKERSWKEGIHGSSIIKCRPADVETAISWCFSNDLSDYANFQSQFQRDEKTFAWTGPVYTVRRRSEAELSKLAPPPSEYSPYYYAI